MVKMESWTDLPLDIVELILEKIESHEDFISFSIVCNPWLSVARRNFFRLPYQLPISHFFPLKNPLPMLLKPCVEDPNTYSLLCVTNNKIYGGFYAPELKNKWIAGSMGGWLVTVDTQNYQIDLINPLSRKQISLPPLSSIPNPIKGEDHGENTNFYFVRRVYLFSDPVEDPENCIVVALVSNIYAIAFCRIGDNKWEKIEKIGPVLVTDIIKCSNNVLYAVNFESDLFSIDLDRMKVTMVAWCHLAIRTTSYHFANLVELSGELVLLQRCVGNPSSTYKFKAFKLKEVPSYSNYYLTEDDLEHDVDGIKYRWYEVKSIGDHAVFVGYNKTISFDSQRYPGSKGNCIYFTDYLIDFDRCRVDNWYGSAPFAHDVGIYHLDDDRVETFSHFTSCPRYQAVWFSPIRE